MIADGAVQVAIFLISVLVVLAVVGLRELMELNNRVVTIEVMISFLVERSNLAVKSEKLK